jgi:hypothetical protein
MSLRSFIRSILDGKSSPRRIGSVTVAEDADRYNLVAAIKDQDTAKSLSLAAQSLFLAGFPDAAVTKLCESIVLEDSIGNMWGLVSDLGNIAEIWRHGGKYDKAEEIFIWLRLKVEALIAKPDPRSDYAPTEHELRDYWLLYGQHTHGLALVYVSTKRLGLANDLVPEMLNAYEKAGNPDGVRTATELRSWLKKNST